jgi:CRP-like cAMP-binding protein
MSPSVPVARNLLIGALPARGRRALIARCERFELQPGAQLCSHGNRFGFLLFPLSGAILSTAHADGPASIGIGLVGHEGMLGTPLDAGEAQASATGAIVLIAGDAMRLSDRAMRSEMLISPPLRRVIERYRHALLRQTARLAACTYFHEIEPRLAQWLLRLHDRAHAGRFHLTHESLAGLLGVRRSGVSLAAARLQERQLIHYARGEIEVLDRARLEAISCSCHGVMRDIYDEAMQSPS